MQKSCSFYSSSNYMNHLVFRLHSNLDTGKLPTKAEEYLSTTINTLVPRNNYADLVNAGYIKAERRSSKSKNIDDFFQIR